MTRMNTHTHTLLWGDFDKRSLLVGIQLQRTRTIGAWTPVKHLHVCCHLALHAVKRSLFFPRQPRQPSKSIRNARMSTHSHTISATANDKTNSLHARLYPATGKSAFQTLLACRRFWIECHHETIAIGFDKDGCSTTFAALPTCSAQLRRKGAHTPVFGCIWFLFAIISVTHRPPE
jgi:hypothetical protein